MLALAERQVLNQGLDWAFCDTDSVAIANVHDLPHEEFKARALQVHGWFKDLNPYGEERSILQLEKVNFPPGKDGDLEVLDPPLCLAVSAKRYVLFNRSKGQLVIRKASGHGLGHLLAPYDEALEKRAERVKRIGVPLWQEDLWKEIIRAAESRALQSRWFAHHGGNVLAVDLPGHGRSAGPPLTDIGLLADWTERLICCNRASLVGHSMGALIAVETAARHPDRSASLCLIGAAAKMLVHPDLLAAAKANSHSAVDMVSLWGLGARDDGRQYCSRRLDAG